METVKITYNYECALELCVLHFTTVIHRKKISLLIFTPNFEIEVLLNQIDMIRKYRFYIEKRFS